MRLEGLVFACLQLSVEATHCGLLPALLEVAKVVFEGEADMLRKLSGARSLAEAAGAAVAAVAWISLVVEVQQMVADVSGLHRAQELG